MTDTSFPLVKPVNGPDLINASLPPPSFAPFPQQRYTVSIVDGAQEDDGQINCVCGYADDDGLTVACDECNRWQHIVCYYPHFEHTNVPEDLQHFCVDCRPQSIDVGKAISKQRARREHTEPFANGNKRNSSKGQKKKAKDAGAAAASLVTTNGWSVDKNRHDRNSASPRDQPPPAKRPKTSHRTSDSTSTTANSKSHSRKRNLSSVHHQRRSVSRSPDVPTALYSEEFLQCHLDDKWDITHANVYNSISVHDSLSAWLNASKEDFKDEHGHDKTTVLMRWDGELDDIPGRAEIEIRTDHDDTVQYHGQHPAWKLVTAKEPIANDAYIGELKGHLDFKKEYQADPANRWAHLRHPEPFVFFHPKLPIVIDARNEGTELRFVRRSCMPNARLQILVTDNRDYHFCFMATQQIEAGVEIAVPWDTSDALPEHLSPDNVSEHMDLLSNWTSTVVANCGPCACQRPENECHMSRLVRRLARDYREEPLPPPVKASKSKKRKAANQVSPLNTHGANSRSGSEAKKIDPEDEPTDSRSASGSIGRGSASRDMTPNTHYSTNGSLSTMPELSERERKKLAKEEEMFRRQEEERAIKQGKKKRNSGGSNMNTPVTSSSAKQLGYPPALATSKYADAGTNSRQATSLSSKPAPARRSKPPKSAANPGSKTLKRPKPIYVEASTQCDLDMEEAAACTPTPPPKKAFVSHRQRLLERAARNNFLTPYRKTPLLSSPRPDTASDSSRMDVDQSISPLATAALKSEPDAAHQKAAIETLTPDTGDAQMQDVPSAEAWTTSPLAQAGATGIDERQGPTNKASPSIGSPAPPWLPKGSQSPELAASRHKPVDMHLQMPPPQANPFATQPLPPSSAGTPGSALAQSPAGIPGPLAIFSPSVTAAVTPSPARKKLSLSDWSNRRKADNEAKQERESSPASTASGPVVPPLQPSTSSEAIAAEGGSAIEEDVKMEDVGDRS